MCFIIIIIQNFHNLYFFKKYKSLFILEFIFLIYIIFYNVNYNNILNNNILNIKFWKYIFILNNNNNSILLILIIFIFLLNLNKINFKNNINLINLVLLLFIFKNINPNIFSTSNTLLNMKIINTSLINGILLIHPFIMYYCYVLFLIFTYFFFKEIKSINKCIIEVKKKNELLLKYSFISLFLGSYWAQQELNWGGWWNWDFVEIIAFIFFFYSIINYHIKLNFNYNYIKKFCINIIYCFFVFFFLVRIDILNSIHSFNSIKLSKNYFYIFFLGLLLYNYNFIKICFKFFLKNFLKKNLKIKQFFILFFINIFIYYINYNLITTYFFNTQFIEITKYIKYVLLIFINLLFLYLIKINKLFIFLNFFFFHKIYFLFILNIFFVFNYFYKKYFYKIVFHYIIIYFILNCLFYSYSNINNCFPNNYINCKNIKLINNNIILLDNFDKFLSNFYYFNNNNYYSTYFNEIHNSNIFIKNNNFILIYNILKNNYFNIFMKNIHIYYIFCILYIVKWLKSFNNVKYTKYIN